jgi:N-acetylmuramoyl-L-alanine amidase
LEKQLTSAKYNRMQQTILSEVFAERPLNGTLYNTIKKADGCKCGQCRQQEMEYEAPLQKSNDQGFITKGVDALKEYIDKGIISLKLISDFSSGVIYDERQIVNRIFSFRYPKGVKNAEKIKEEIRNKIARTHFANFHAKLPDKNPACAPDFVLNLKDKTVNKTTSKGGVTFSNKSMKHSPRKNIIDSIVLHHMAITKGYPGRSDRGNDVNNYLRTGAHYIVLHDGKVGQLYDDKDYLNASDSFNSRSIAIEFAGNFPYENFKWWNSGPTDKTPNPAKYFTYLTPAQALAGRCLIENIKKNNTDIKYILAHRQACGPDRPHDPGRDVWLAVGEWAIRNLGLSDKDSAGNPILGKCYNCTRVCQFFLNGEKRGSSYFFYQ